jgi:hypothetical protein
MSHFTVMVIGDDPEKQLAPYQENNMGDCPKEFLKWKSVVDKYIIKKGIRGLLNKFFKVKFINIQDIKKDGYKFHNGIPGYWENPNCKWDGYELGGRWTGFFKLKSDIKGNFADQARKGDINFEAMQILAAEDAEKEYNIVKKLGNGEIPKIKISWKTITDSQNSEYKNLSIEQKREIYWNQDALILQKEVKKNKNLTDEEKNFILWCNLQSFQCTFEEYVQKAKDSAIATFAYIKDGKWYERGQMGWWCCISNEKDENEWNNQITKEILSLPDDTLLSVYDCHI